MNDKDNVMSYESVLPVDFDGVFRFSNPTDEDFKGLWNKKEYLFPAKSTVPMIMPEHSPLEIQHIRKKFAKDLAEREFFKSKQYETFRLREGVKDDMGMIQPRGSGMSHAGQYTMNDLEPFIKQCLEPLDGAQMMSKDSNVVVPVEDKLHRKDDGSFTTEAIDSKASLKQKALTG